MLPGLKYIKYNILNKRILIENFTFLGVLHVTNLILFLITVPFLFKVLGSRLYGLIVFAQALVAYFSIFINYGFNLSATRDVAIYRDDEVKLSEIISSVITLKVILFIISLLMMIILTIVFYNLRIHRELFILSMLMCLSEALFPVWYFQGMERMKYITYLNASTRIVAVIGVILFIKSEKDYLLYPILMGTGMVSGSLISLFLMFSQSRIQFRFQPVKQLISYFSGNLMYFLSNVSSQVYAYANKLIIGSFLGLVEVAYYDIAEKVVNILRVPYSLLGQTIFPKYSRDRNVNFLKKMFFLTMIMTVFLLGVLYIFSDEVVLLLTGSENYNSVMTMRILSLTLVPLSFIMYFGDIVLITYDRKKEYTFMKFSGLLLYITLFLTVKVIGSLNVFSLAVITVTVEYTIAFYAYYLCNRHNWFRVS